MIDKKLKLMQVLCCFILLNCYFNIFSEIFHQAKCEVLKCKFYKPRLQECVKNMVFDKIKSLLFFLLYLLLCDIYSILFICHFMWKNISRKDVSNNVYSKRMRDECRLKNAAEKFHILFIIYKNKKGFRK